MLSFPMTEDDKLPELTYVLAKRNLDKIGILQNITSSSTSQSLVDPNEFSLTCYKKLNGIICNNWNDIEEDMLIFIPEVDEFYNISMSVEENNNTTKTITCTSLCHYELSNLKLYNTEINTDVDIEREEYKVPTQFLNRENEEASLLHRILKDKASHYTIGHVDETLHNIQRVFSFDSISIYDALQNIAKEIECIFMFDSTTRTIFAYDELSYCNTCKKRGTYIDRCENCESEDIIPGYGEDTSLLISAECNTEQINLTVESGSSFNCFRLTAGDDYFNATLKSINPNGSNYIYYFSEDDRKKMPNELVLKIDEYNAKTQEIDKSYCPTISDDLKIKYNNLIDKYNGDKYASYKYNQDGEKELINNSFMPIDDKIIGFSKLINLYYDNIDFQLLLEHSLMPTVNNDIIKAETEILKLTEENLSPIGLQNVTQSTSSQTAESALKNYTKIFVNSRYKVEIKTISFDYEGENEEGFNIANWDGTITLTNYSDDKDTATTEQIILKFSDNYDYYVEQKIRKALKNDDKDSDQSIFDIINLESDDDFKAALVFYNSSRLNSYLDAYQSGLDILIEIDQASESADLYDKLYVPYKRRLVFVQEELDLRIAEIELCSSIAEAIDKDNISKIQVELDLKNNLGILWSVFWTYIREDRYENSNYISDGLDNKNLIIQANQFIDLAKRELIKASSPILNIETSLNNLFQISGFNKKQFIDNFKLGNWLRVIIDNKIYRLRLINYSINFDTQSIMQIQTTFSNITVNNNPMQQSKKLLDSVTSISNSYPSIEKQVDKNKQASEHVMDFIKNGLDATKIKIFNSKDVKKVIQDKNGITIRGYDDINDEYSAEQMKLTNSTLAITDNNWESVKTAIGKFVYYDPFTKEYKTGYGVNAETIVGSFILGENLSLMNKSGTLKFDNDGLVINTTPSNDVYKKLFRLQKDGIDKAYFDDNGNLTIEDLIAKNGYFSGKIDANEGMIAGWKITENALESNSDTNSSFKINSESREISFTVKGNASSSMIYSNNGIMFEAGVTNEGGRYEYTTMSLDSSCLQFGGNMPGENGYYGATSIQIGNILNWTTIEAVGDELNIIPSARVHIYKDLFVDGNCSVGSLTNRSSEKNKDNIKEITELDTLSVIKSSKIYQYNLVSDLNLNIKHKRYGFILERETPKEIISLDSQGVDIYSIATLSWDAIKKMSIEIDILKNKIKNLEGK